MGSFVGQGLLLNTGASFDRSAASQSDLGVQQISSASSSEVVDSSHSF